MKKFKQKKEANHHANRKKKDRRKKSSPEIDQFIPNDKTGTTEVPRWKKYEKNDCTA